jgi:putative flippase GtrA
MVHPDYQYDPKLVKYFVEFIRDGYFDVMLGSRIRSRTEALAGGMPPYKYYANRVLTFFQNIASGRSLGEWHTGMRAYHRLVLEHTPYEQFSNDFVFDTQMLFAIVEGGYAIGDIPVPVRYFKEASSINFIHSCRYGMLTVLETVKFLYRQHGDVVRYGVVGAVSLLCNIGLFSLLFKEFHLWYITASVISFAGGGVVSFLLHKFWTFKRKQLSYVLKELPNYLLVVLTNLALVAALVFVFVNRLSFGEWVANLAANLIVAFWGFILFKYFVFQRHVS